MHVNGWDAVIWLKVVVRLTKLLKLSTRCRVFMRFFFIVFQQSYGRENISNPTNDSRRTEIRRVKIRISLCCICKVVRWWTIMIKMPHDSIPKKTMETEIVENCIVRLWRTVRPKPKINWNNGIYSFASSLRIYHWKFGIFVDLADDDEHANFFCGFQTSGFLCICGYFDKVIADFGWDEMGWARDEWDMSVCKSNAPITRLDCILQTGFVDLQWPWPLFWWTLRLALCIW